MSELAEVLRRANREAERTLYFPRNTVVIAPSSPEPPREVNNGKKVESSEGEIEPILKK